MATVRTSSMQISGISSMALRQILAELAQTHEALSGQHVFIESVGGVEAARRVQDGQVFDIVVLAADAIDRLIELGRLDARSRVDIARSGIAVAVLEGAPRPAINTELELRETILAARSIGYSTGPSGVHLVRLFERWGITQTVASRVVQSPPGVPVGALVARGEVAVGFQQKSELIGLPGVAVIGPLPPSAQLFTKFQAAVCTASIQQVAANALLAFLHSSRADAAKLRYGTEPPLRPRSDVTAVGAHSC